jgi:lipopolysaccharide export system protein LptA
MSLGNIRIQYARLKGNIRTATYVMTDVKIMSRDASQPTQFVLLADQVKTKQVTISKKETAYADFSGHIRYTITRKTKEGVRTIQGTAGHAIYNEAEKQISLTDGVHTNLTEEARLEGPATLQSSSATIMTDQSDRYLLAGDPGVNDIRFTPRRTAKVKDKAEPQPIAGAPVHLHGFRNGEITPGHSLEAIGPETQIDLIDPVENSSGSLNAERISADFGTEVDHAAAKGNVHFHYERQNKKDGKQILSGRGDTANYDAAQHRLTVAGNVDATLTAPQSLLEPAHLVAGKVTTHTEPPRKDDPKQIERSLYEISGAPERTSLVFRPRPKEKSEKEAVRANDAPTDVAQPKTDPLQKFVIGTVRVTGFDSGTFEPGHDAVLIGDQTTLRTEDKQAHTSSLLRTSRLTAKFAADQTLEQLDALGNVRFELKQPAPTKATATAQPQQANAATQVSGKPVEAGPKIQTFNATAAKATLVITTDGQILKVPGPWRTSETTDDPNERTVTSGEKGDTLTYNLTTGDVDMDSPNRTAYLDTVAAKPQTAQAKKPSAPPRKKQNR